MQQFHHTRITWAEYLGLELDLDVSRLEPEVSLGLLLLLSLRELSWSTFGDFLWVSVPKICKIKLKVFNLFEFIIWYQCT